MRMSIQPASILSQSIVVLIALVAGCSSKPTAKPELALANPEPVQIDGPTSDPLTMHRGKQPPRAAMDLDPEPAKVPASTQARGGRGSGKGGQGSGSGNGAGGSGSGSGRGSGSGSGSGSSDASGAGGSASASSARQSAAQGKSKSAGKASSQAANKDNNAANSEECSGGTSSSPDAQGPKVPPPPGNPTQQDPNLKDTDDLVPIDAGAKGSADRDTPSPKDSRGGAPGAKPGKAAPPTPKPADPDEAWESTEETRKPNPASNEGTERGEEDDVSAPADGASDPDAPPTRPEPAGKEPNSKGGIDLPKSDVKPIDLDESLIDEAGKAADGVRVHPLQGVWIQIGGGNDADFGTGGYADSLVSVDVRQGIVSVLRRFEGSAPTMHAGEFRISLDSDERAAKGSATLTLDPSLNGRFLQRDGKIGTTTWMAAKGTGPWQLSWDRSSADLVLGGKTYRRTTPASFDEARRKGPSHAPKVPDSPKESSKEPQASGGASGDVRFMGIKGTGSRFAFIVDISNSMLESWGNGSRLDHAKAELVKSIRALPPNTEFMVIFFSSQAHRLSDGWLVAGRDTDATVARVMQQSLAAGTDPRDALQFAIQGATPPANCIFLMTDGELPDGTIPYIRELNNSLHPVPIHTIGLGSTPAMASVLEKIAEENDGSFRAIQP